MCPIVTENLRHKLQMTDYSADEKQKAASYASPAQTAAVQPAALLHRSFPDRCPPPAAAAASNKLGEESAVPRFPLTQIALFHQLMQGYFVGCVRHSGSNIALRECLFQRFCKKYAKRALEQQHNIQCCCSDFNKESKKPKKPASITRHYFIYS